MARDAVIPADKARFGMFDALRDKAEADVRALVDELGRTPAPAGTVRQKVADLYASWMDEARIEARGLEPLRADLAAIDAASTKTDLIRLMGRTEFSAPFGFGISADPADPTRYVVTISQAGLGMPVRDYYLAPGEKFDGYRAAYRTYVTRIFELLGDPAPAESAATVIALETKLAQAHWPREQRRDVKATNNPMDRAGLAAAIPAMDWQAALEPSGLGAVSRVVVREVSARKTKKIKKKNKHKKKKSLSTGSLREDAHDHASLCRRRPSPPASCSPRPRRPARRRPASRRRPRRRSAPSASTRPRWTPR